MIYLLRKVRSKLMNQKKFFSYGAYAIGEILLVVIGIYIAIQFNNWNEGKKAKELVKTNIGILIETLKEDSIYYRERLSRIDYSREILNDYQRRLSQPTANLDTLIKITRYEFSPGIVKVDKDNNDTYNSMTMSGEINLFPKDLRQEIFSLYARHKVLEGENSSHFYSYLENLNTFNAKFGLQFTSPYKEGPIADAIWKDVDMRELAVAFHPLMNTKRNHLGQVRRELINVMDMTDALLIKLNNSLDD